MGHKETNSSSQSNPTQKVKTKKSKRYVLAADERLAKRLDTHLKVLKAVDGQSFDRKDWVKSAVRNKLNRDRVNNTLSLNKPKYIALTIDPEMAEELDKRMELIRECSGISSLKKWILEAIEEQFEREEHKVFELQSR